MSLDEISLPQLASVHGGDQWARDHHRLKAYKRCDADEKVHPGTVKGCIGAANFLFGPSLTLGDTTRYPAQEPHPELEE